MTTANQRGGYIKKLSVSRDGDSKSVTTFRDQFLKKTQNYVLQIPRFVTNVTPPLNLISEVMFELLPRGNVGVLPANVGANLIIKNAFTAKPYRSWSELARQLQAFFKAADVEIGDENMIQFELLDDGCFRLKLTEDFCDIFYIKVGPETQKKTGFPEYMFQVQGIDDSVLVDVERHFNHTDGLEYLLDGEPLVFAEYQAVVDDAGKFESRFPLDSFDTRISLDVTVTFPISSKISGFNGVEQREYILARFPLTDYKTTWSEVTIEDDNKVHQGNTVSEKISIGLADLTRKNSEMISVFMLPGEIYHANFQLEIRYFSEGKIISVPANMENGFWHLEILFSKKKT